MSCTGGTPIQLLQPAAHCCLPLPLALQGSWIIRQSVGTTPVLLGQKLTTKYSRGPNYLEVRDCCSITLSTLVSTRGRTYPCRSRSSGAGWYALTPTLTLHCPDQPCAICAYELASIASTLAFLLL